MRTFDPFYVDVRGLECDFEHSTLCRDICEAIRSLPGADAWGEDYAFEQEAYSIAAEMWRAIEANLPNNRDATYIQSEKDLRRLDKLAGDLSRHISKMRGPAISGLIGEGVSPERIAADLAEIREAARQAFYDLDKDQGRRGARKKEDAARVKAKAAEVFREVTGLDTTFTTNPITSEISGKWPEFLEKIYSMLRIKASVSSQIRSDD